MIRLAALLLLVSQAILLWLLFRTTGSSAILFSFVGLPLLGAGMSLLVIAALRERQRQPPGSG